MIEGVAYHREEDVSEEDELSSPSLLLSCSLPSEAVGSLATPPPFCLAPPFPSLSCFKAGAPTGVEWRSPAAAKAGASVGTFRVRMEGTDEASDGTGVARGSAGSVGKSGAAMPCAGACVSGVGPRVGRFHCV